MTKFRNLIEYLLLKSVAAFLMSFPLDYSLKIAGFIADIAFLLPNRFSKRGMRHLRMVYPDKSLEELNQILRRALRHFAMVFVEILSLPSKVHANSYTKYVTVKGTQYLDEGLKKGHGVIMVAAHFGNWELAGPPLRIMGYPVNAVARFMPNARVDALLNRSRLYLGEKVIYKENAIKDMMKALKKNELLAIVADQDARDGGIFVDFLGIPSSTTRSPALLNIRFGSPLVMLTCYRSEKDKFKYVLEFSPCPISTNLEDVAQITQAFANELTKTIHQHPEQWMWFHRRWKSTPAFPSRKA